MCWDGKIIFLLSYLLIPLLYSRNVNWHAIVIIRLRNMISWQNMINKSMYRVMKLDSMTLVRFLTSRRYSIPWNMLWGPTQILLVKACQLWHKCGYWVTKHDSWQDIVYGAKWVFPCVMKDSRIFMRLLHCKMWLCYQIKVFESWNVNQDASKDFGARNQMILSHCS